MGVDNFVHQKCTVEHEWHEEHNLSFVNNLKRLKKHVRNLAQESEQWYFFTYSNAYKRFPRNLSRQQVTFAASSKAKNVATVYPFAIGDQFLAIRGPGHPVVPMNHDIPGGSSPVDRATMSQTFPVKPTLLPNPDSETVDPTLPGDPAAASAKSGSTPRDPRRGSGRVGFPHGCSRRDNDASGPILVVSSGQVLSCGAPAVDHSLVVPLRIGVVVRRLRRRPLHGVISGQDPADDKRVSSSIFDIHHA